MNEGFPPQGNKAPPNEQVLLRGHVLVHPLIFTDGDIKAYLVNLTQVVDTQAQVLTI